jgi:hypothetical protein
MMTAREMRRAGRRITALGLILALVLVLGGSAVGVFEYFTYQHIVSQYKAHEAALFRVGSSLLINIPGLPEPELITDEYRVSGSVRRGDSLHAKSSYDSRFIAYLNNIRTMSRQGLAGDLFLLDLVLLSEESESNDGALISTDVVDFRFLPRSDRMLYLTQDGDLILCDYAGMLTPLRMMGRTRERLIDTGVSGIGEIDGRYMLYYKGDSPTGACTWQENMETETGRPFDLYIVNFEDENPEPSLVAEGVYRVDDYMREFERVVFTKRTRMPPLAMYDVYVFHRRDARSVLIARDARHIVDASAARASVLCLAPSEETLSFRDIIDDDMVLFDQELQEPYWPDYAPDDDIDVSRLDPAVLDEIYALYDEAQLRYEEKLARDQLRRVLRTDIRNFMQNNYLSFGLFYTDGENTVKLADQIYNRGGDVSALAWGDIEAGVALYVRGEREDMRSVLMSELEYEQVLELGGGQLDVMRYLSMNMPDILWEHKFGEAPREVFAESGARQISRVLMVGEGIYFSVLQGAIDEPGTLYYTAVSGESAGAVVYLDEHVTEYIGLWGADKASLAYRKITRGMPSGRDISVATGGSARTIAQGTYPYSPVLLLGENADVFAFYRRQDIHSPNELYISREFERFIAQGVSEVGLISEELIYLLREGADANLDLYRINEITRVSTNVDAVMFLGLQNP